MKVLSWEVEDTFFGAILGAFLGTFIDDLSIINVLLLVCFFILFPAILRKTYHYPVYSIVAVNFINLLWIILFIYDLNDKNVVTLEKGIVLILIFLGWLISKNLRMVS